LTHANGEMVVDMTDRIDAASSGARIDTLLVDASPIRWTFAVENTLRPASYKWIPLETGLAGAHRSVASGLADRIAATWGRPTGVCWLFWHHRLDDIRLLGALAVRVSVVVLGA
jgi:hypothetical protein